MRSACFAFLLALGAAVACGKPQVVTTHTVLADLVTAIAGDHVEVKCLLPINLDPHSYEPKPADIRLLAHADLVVINGFGLEPWSDKVITNSGFTGLLVKTSDGLPRLLPLQPGEKETQGVSPAEHYDPHAWHNPANAKHYVVTIRDALNRISPADRATFTANALAYSEKLDALDRYAREQFSKIPAGNRKLVTSHDSLRYLADAYGLKIIPVAGTRPDQEPSARQLAELIRVIRNEHVRAVFFEATASPKLAQIVAQETGVRIVKELYTDSLGPADSPGGTYLGMFRSNVDTIVAALTE